MLEVRGFTLIELLVVLVVLGVVASQAIPRFANVRTDARKATIDSVAAALTTASSINHAIRSVNPGKGVSISMCSHAASLLPGGLPPSFSLAALPLPVPKDQSRNCVIYGPAGDNGAPMQATASITGIP